MNRNESRTELAAHPRPLRLLLSWLVLTAMALALASACGPLRLGNKFRTEPTKIKVGHDAKKDVIAKMGAPYRTAMDSRGQEVLTYVWADGGSRGEKAIIVLNKNGLVSLVEVVR